MIGTRNISSRISKSLLCIVVSSIVLLQGCASVGPSSVKLSADIGSRMSEMQELHQRALQGYFAAERSRVEEFLSNTWEPLFLKNFLAESNVLEDLNNVSAIDDDRQHQIEQAISESLTDESETAAATNALFKALTASRSGESTVVRNVLKDYIDDDQLEQTTSHVTALLGTDESARIMLDFAEFAHEIMNETRNEMLEPLRQAEAKTMAEVSGAYARMSSAQGLITGRLAAASKVARQQDNLLDSLTDQEGVLGNLRERLSGVSETVGDALVSARKALPDSEEAGENESSKSRVDKALQELRLKLQKLTANPD